MSREKSDDETVPQDREKDRWRVEHRFPSFDRNRERPREIGERFSRPSRNFHPRIGSSILISTQAGKKKLFHVKIDKLKFDRTWNRFSSKSIIVARMSRYLTSRMLRESNR